MTEQLSWLRYHRREFIIGLLSAAAIPSTLRAQTYPAKTIQIIVPFAPGGVNDVLGRIIAQKLQDQIGKPVVVENRPGAGGDIGTEFVAKAEPDGYTLLMSEIGLTIKPSIKSLRYDPRVDLTPLARLAIQPMIIVSKPDLPADNLADFIQMAKAQPGKFTYGSPGVGTPQHFGTELLCAEAGIKMVHVTYRGAVPAMTDIMAGQIDLYFATETSGGSYIEAGKMKPLAITGQKRISRFPNVKTVIEYGLPKSAIPIWYSIMGPGKLPDDIVARLAAELRTMAQSEDYRKRLAALALDPSLSSPQELQLQIDKDISFWQEFARSVGIKGE